MGAWPAEAVTVPLAVPLTAPSTPAPSPTR